MFLLSAVNGVEEISRILSDQMRFIFVFQRLHQSCPNRRHLQKLPTFNRKLFLRSRKIFLFLATSFASNVPKTSCYIHFDQSFRFGFFWLGFRLRASSEEPRQHLPLVGERHVHHVLVPANGNFVMSQGSCSLVIIRLQIIRTPIRIPSRPKGFAFLNLGYKRCYRMELCIFRVRINYRWLCIKVMIKLFISALEISHSNIFRQYKICVN